MTAPCSNCEAAAARPHWGGYSMACTACCARLVLSCAPDKSQAEVMLACVVLRPGRPERRTVLDAVRALKAGATLPQPETPQGTLL